MIVRFHPDAATELLEARSWYQARSPLSALGFAREIARAVELIERSPSRYPQIGAGTRRFLLRRFPFGVVHRQVGEGIEVVAVAHLKRRPQYWSRR